MAFQVHRLFAYGNFTSSRLLVMVQCRTLQSYSGTCLQFTPFNNGGNYIKCAQLKFRKAGDTCRITTGCLKNHLFKVERDSFLLKSSFDDYRHSCAVTFHTQLRVAFPFPMKYSNPSTYSFLRSNVKFNFLSQEYVRRRFFSVKASESSEAQKIPTKVGGNVRDGKAELNKTPLKPSDSFRRPAKQFVVRSSGANRQVAVLSQPVKKSASNVIKSVPKSSHGTKPKDEKKDMKLQSSVSVSSQPVKKSASDVIKSVPKNLHGLKPKDGKKDVKLESSVSVPTQPVKKSASDAIKSVPKDFHALKAKNGKKGLKLESSVPVSNQPVKKSASDAIISVPKNLRESKHKDGKKDVKLESSVSTSAKSSGNKKNPQAQGKKKQSGNKREKVLSGSTVPPGDAKVNGSKQASHVKKPNVATGDGKFSQASEILPAGETPLSRIDNSPLTHEKSKKTVGKPARKRKPQKQVVVHMKPDNGPAKIKNSPVLVEVKKRPVEKGLKSLYPPTGKSVVVVESLTKAKVIQGYLGDMFEVLPSYGHVRDLAGRSGSVRPDDDFSMVWEVPAAAWTHLKCIKVALNGAENLILASDPDREGEAIAWHITEMLQKQGALNDDINVSRVVFHEITEPSIKSALQAPRDIDANLVHAYLARRALDYLIGFSISPLLWRKLPACQSAGRVQSAALALVCDREMEIDEFRPHEYWTVEVGFNKTESGSSANVHSFLSHLTYLDFKKLEQLSINSCEEAHAIEQKMISSRFEVSGSKRSKSRRNPPTPYITSTLQQDAANKLNFSASYTMKLAQKLYEGVKLTNDEATGLITYMRTDGLHVSDVAAKDICSLVIERYGQAFASESPRKFFKKVKNAQEAHEAIRPTSIRRLPSMLTGVLDEDSLKLYTLIWSRTMACQMVPTVIDQIQIDIGGAGSFFGLRSTCSKVEFFGYQAAYKDTEAAAIGHHEKEGDTREEAFEVLCKLKTGDLLDLGKVELKQHFTQPPPRYSEGSLVKKLEELGIGRPSTYASTIKVLQDRKYILVKSRTLHPEFRGRMVSAFLSHHFTEVTDYSFTADMETELDNVSAGMTEWKGLLKDYWTRFKTYCDRAGKVEIRQVEKMLEKTFEDFLFASLKSRTCPSCLTGTLIFKVSRFGAGYFIGCDQHPNCKYIAKTIYGDDEEEDNPQITQFPSEPKLLGLHPTSNEKVVLKTGPYGSYVQLGEDRKGHSPKRASASLIKDVGSITLEQALDLLQYPLLLGNHPDDGEPVHLKITKYGFSIRHRHTNAPVPKNLDPKKINLGKAIKLLLSKDAKSSGRKRKPKLEEPVEAI